MNQNHRESSPLSTQADDDDDVALTSELASLEKPARMSHFARGAVQVMWPAFLGAALAVGVFFSAIDPLEIEFVGIHLSDSREGAYTIGFFLFWILFMVSGSITWFLASTDHDTP